MVGASEELEMGYEKDCASIVYSMRFGKFLFLSWCLSPPAFLFRLSHVGFAIFFKVIHRSVLSLLIGILNMLMYLCSKCELIIGSDVMSF